MRFLVMGVMPVGSLVGGILPTTFEPRTTLWITAVIASLAFLPVLLRGSPSASPKVVWRSCANSIWRPPPL